MSLTLTITRFYVQQLGYVLHQDFVFANCTESFEISDHDSFKYCFSG